MKGKPGLPEPDPEPEDGTELPAVDVEDEDEQDEQDKEITFTEKDRKDLPILEQRIKGGLQGAAEAIRAIRWRQLWRLLRDNAGNQLYLNFEAYCQDRLGHSRQWVTHLTNWLRIVEELEAIGFPVPQLTVKAAQGLLNGRLKDAGGLRAVLEEAKEAGVPFDRDHLREIVLRRADYHYWSTEGKEGVTKPAAKTYAEYKKDLTTVKELGDGQTSWDVVQRAKALEGDFADNLVTLCRRERKLPKANNLLTLLTGEPLKEVVSRLKEVGKEGAEIEEKKTLLATLKEQIRERQQEGGLRKLKEEAKALEQELKAKGVLKSNGKPSPTDPQGDSTPPQPDKHQEDDEEKEADSEVYKSLQTALENLEEALTWNWPDEESELDAILLKAQECEKKLAEITAKAKELLADAEQPEVVPSGNN